MVQLEYNLSMYVASLEMTYLLKVLIISIGSSDKSAINLLETHCIVLGLPGAWATAHRH